ncbi:caspase family protein [Haliangium ochraceum]|uniref:Peptidase C14 caspase catalytic subunit p20 n=1 Tax=Haliangium ochraceum (strain DSM 14365 / JCM 11303 / SMP-2) TaxID=502025 RepID=D0LS26_HALO1|nr:caspase family protein [Haliangium ochraceum]ACY13723.1 peptidase C14 caspase catalytic subunit p20 [Haliangium ochraceum DSM 14365]
MLHVISIGINRFADPQIRDLACATNDARAVGALFRERIASHERRVITLLDEQATRANIMHTIGSVLARNATPNDVAVIYMATHGSPERATPNEEDHLYLVAHDTLYERIYATGIDMEHDMARWLQRLGVRLAVLFLDACFSGGAGGRTFCGPTRRENRTRFLDEPITLEELDLGEGRVIIAAAKDDQVALESRSLGHGFFTHHLLETLRRTPERSARIGLSELYETVSEAVMRATNSQQRPVFNGYTAQGALPLLGAPVDGAGADATTRTTDVRPTAQ